MKALTLPLTSEIEYQSAEKKARTGNAILRDASGYVGKVSAGAAEDIVKAVNMHDKLVRVLKALMTNEHVDLGDMVYAVREREGRGWNGPSVEAWSNAVEEAGEILKQCA